MHISLTPELEGIIQAKVRSGYYSNASEVVRDAIRRLHEQDTLSGQLKLALHSYMQNIQQDHTVARDEPELDDPVE
ncbi:MAG: type II toxin-antitoxin system ParD family antitoxin [Cyanobacteria bacterium J06649_5]